MATGVAARKKGAAAEFRAAAAGAARLRSKIRQAEEALRLCRAKGDGGDYKRLYEHSEPMIREATDEAIRLEDRMAELAYSLAGRGDGPVLVSAGGAGSYLVDRQDFPGGGGSVAAVTYLPPARLVALPGVPA